MLEERENMSIFDFLEEEESDFFHCDTCKHDVKGCCDYDEPLGRHCVLGDAYEEDLERMTIKYVAKTISEAVGKEFVEDYLDACDYYTEFKTKNYGFVTITISFGRYVTSDDRQGERFIGVSNCNSAHREGGGVSCATISEAITHIESVIRRVSK